MNMTSPCINVCKLDSSDVCTGCYRTRDEIARWMEMTEDERLQIISMLAGRQVAKLPEQFTTDFLITGPNRSA